MSAGSDIAAEVLAGLIEAGEATGDGQLHCTIEKGIGAAETPWSTDDDRGGRFEVTAVQTTEMQRDGVGSVTKKTRQLLIDATGDVVEKGDRVAIGVRLSDADAETQFERIAEVEAVSPGGVPVMFIADLEN